MATAATATPTPMPALAPVLRPLWWLTEALVSAVEVGETVLLLLLEDIDEVGPDGV